MLRAHGVGPDPERAPRSFVLGMGSAKAGTTWLAGYLHAHPQYVKGYQKEYHVFDSVDLGTDQFARRRLLDRARAAVEDLAAGGPGDASVLHRLAMVSRESLYFDHFAQVLADRPRARATGEFTPNYALLSRSRLERIRDEFATRGLRTAPVFLMRDPVERSWSQVRMKLERNPRLRGLSSVQHLLERHLDEEYLSLSSYEAVVTDLVTTFGRDGVHLAFYERLFEPESVEELCSFLGLRVVPADFGRRRNATVRSDREDQLPEDVARRVAQSYAATYRFVATQFPEIDVPRTWPHARHVLG